ncbi:acyltransferase family protein [Aliarcobacter cryaerophilus]|uniref:acyltransferase family protein n=1 Tax=Aliarcobacter cryaerophilus TaxID=28198 RepID=UPI003DA4653B
MTKEKLIWIDNLKAIGIFAVILGHIASPFGTFIYSWHMPLFFMIAGFFIKFDLSLKEFIIKDFKRLMIPYFLFAIVGLLLETIKRITLHRESLDYIHEIKAVFIWMDMSSLINTYAFVLWFLPTLFFSRVFLVVINKFIQNIFFQFFIVTILFSCSFLVQLPLGIDNSLNAILFLFLGNVFFRFYQENKILYFLPILLVGLYIIYGLPSLDMATKTYQNVFLNIVFASSVVYFFILVFKKLNYTSKLLTIWGGNTMLLFIMHPYTNNIAHIIVEKLQFGDWYLKFFISLVLLQGVLFIKQRFKNRGLFKYV